jgi:mRNA-degrading endonuclease RelE of RelBE toxin-antitoxin system
LAVFRIEYSPQAIADLAALRAFERAKVVAAIEKYLVHAPTQLSKSRIKLMRQPFWSQYRLRVDDERVYYNVDEPARRVSVLRILTKGTGPTPGESP